MQSKNCFLFQFCMLSLCLTNIAGASLHPPDSITAAIEYDQTISSIKEEVIDQIDHLLFRLQQIGQQVNNKIVHVKDKTDTTTQIAQTISFAQELKTKIQTQHEASALQNSFEVHRALTKYIQKAVNNKLSEFSAFDHAAELMVKHQTRQLSIEEIKKMLNTNEATLETLDQQARLLGVNWINKVTQKTEKVLKSVYLDKITHRAWPYLLLGHWWLLKGAEVNPQSILGRYQQTLTNFTKRFNLNNVAHNGDIAVQAPDSIAKVAHDLAQFSKDIIKLEDNLHLFSLGLGGVIAPRINKDVKDLSEKLTVYRRKAYAKLKGSEPPRDPLKNPKFTFKRLIGFEGPKKQVQPTIAYLCDPDAFLRSGQKVHRGYLFIGPRYSGKRSLADAIAGEVSEQLKANASLRKSNGNHTTCQIYELHASALLKKPLEKVLEEAREATPCIVVITNLEWLNMKDQNLVGNIIQAMTKYFKEKKEGIVIATTSDINAINPDLMEAGRLTGKVYIDHPNYEERKTFVEKKLGENGLSPEQFSLDTVALATNTHSFKALNTLLEQLFAYANVTQQPITPALFDEVIDREIFHIINHQCLLPDEVKVLAANFAGQAVMHVIKNPAAQLTKVTILPVIDGADKKFGARFTYAGYQLSAANYENMKKECAIAIAGDIAQEIIRGQAGACPLAANKKRAFELAHGMVLKGIDEKLLSKSTCNKMRDEAQALLETITEEVREVLTTHKDALLRIASVLEEKQSLSAEEIQALMA